MSRALTTELTELAQKINQHHQQATQAAQSAVEHARQAGEYLIQAKTELPHGEWLPWLKAHCELSERTAQAYMRVARELPKLEEAKAQRVADLPLREAVALLAEPKEPAAEPKKYANSPFPDLDAFFDQALEEVSRIDQELWDLYDTLHDREDFDDMQRWKSEIAALVYKRENRKERFLIELGGSPKDGLEMVERILEALKKRACAMGLPPIHETDEELFTKQGLSVPFDPSIRPPKGVKAWPKEVKP